MSAHASTNVFARSMVTHMSLQKRRVHIAGSASASCPIERLRNAHTLVRTLTQLLLEAGADLVVFAAGEPRTHDNECSLVFDWTVVEEAHRFFSTKPPTAETRRLLVVTSHKSLRGRIPPERLALIQDLLSFGVLDTALVDDAQHFGGMIRSTIARLSDLLVVVGGGKGVLDFARLFQERGAPVLPFDIDVGASADDTVGGPALYRAALDRPELFFAAVPNRLRTHLALTPLGEGHNAKAVAESLIPLISAELRRRQPPPSPVNDISADVLVLAALPVELRALLAAFGATGTGVATTSGTRVWLATMKSQIRPITYRIAISALGTAGNVSSAVAVTELSQEVRPQLVVFTGIAGGAENNCHLGEVVIAERVVAYESAALVVDDYGSTQIPRPDISTMSYQLHQDVTAYLALDPHSRLAGVHRCWSSAGQAASSESPAPPAPFTIRLTTIASGEKLVRDPTIIPALRKNVHGKIEVVEMEAGGVAAACRRVELPWLIIRGISDLANTNKDDAYHALASERAAAVAADFVAHGLLADAR